MADMQNGQPNGMDAPTSSIRITVGAAEYEPRWSFLAEYLLSTRGLSLQDVLEEANKRGKRTAQYSMELLSACIAHHFPAGAAPDAATLAAQIGPAQFMGVWAGLMAAGRAAGAIIDLPKNEQGPAIVPAENTRTQ